MENLSKEVVLMYWRLMQSNHFESVSAVLSDDFVVEWPQSKERIKGIENFVRMNQEYPTNAPWKFGVIRIVAANMEVVTQVAVENDTVKATCISFFSLADGRINRIVEYWPEPYSAPSNRAHLVEIMD